MRLSAVARVVKKSSFDQDFLDRYGLGCFDDWNYMELKGFYKAIRENVPDWLDWIIKKTGCGYFLLKHFFNFEVSAIRCGEAYIIKIRTPTCSGEYCGGDNMSLRMDIIMMLGLYL